LNPGRPTSGLPGKTVYADLFQGVDMSQRTSAAGFFALIRSLLQRIFVRKKKRQCSIYPLR